MFRNMNKRVTTIAAVVCLLGIMGTAFAVSHASGPAFAGSQSGSVVDPEAAAQPGALVPPAPFLIPPDTETYRPQASNATITAPDKRSIAQLAKPPAAWAKTVETFLPVIQPLKPGTAAHTILSSIRYTGGGQTILVTTAQRTPASAQQPELLGTQTISLANGTKAWATTGLPFKTSNEVVFLHDDLIITVAGDLPVDKLQQLAVGVTIVQ